MAIHTGSTYNYNSMTDIVTIPTANLGFSTRTSSQKASTSDCTIERQPEIAIWPPKPEMVIPLEIQQIASKFQRQFRDVRPWRSQIKCRQVIATMTDNWKWQYRRLWQKSCYLWYSRSLSQSFGYLISSSSSSKTPNLALEFRRYCYSSRDVIISGFGSHSNVSAFATTDIVCL